MTIPDESEVRRAIEHAERVYPQRLLFDRIEIERVDGPLGSELVAWITVSGSTAGLPNELQVWVIRATAELLQVGRLDWNGRALPRAKANQLLP